MIKDAVVLIIDVQEKIAASIDQNDLPIALKNVQILIDASTYLNIPVISTVQYPQGLGGVVKKIKMSEGYEKVKEVEKLHFDAMKENTVSEPIEKLGKKTVILAGFETHICIYQTALALVENGYTVYVASDAVSSRLNSSKFMALREMSNRGVNVVPTETIVFSFIERAGCPEFKYIHKLIK